MNYVRTFSLITLVVMFSGCVSELFYSETPSGYKVRHELKARFVKNADEILQDFTADIHFNKKTGQLDANIKAIAKTKQLSFQEVQQVLAIVKDMQFQNFPR